MRKTIWIKHSPSSVFGWQLDRMQQQSSFRRVIAWRRTVSLAAEWHAESTLVVWRSASCPVEMWRANAEMRTVDFLTSRVKVRAVYRIVAMRLSDVVARGINTRGELQLFL